MWKVIDEAPSFWKPTNKSGDKKLAAAVEAKDGRAIRPPRVPNMKRIRERWSTILYAAYNADRTAEVALEAKRGGRVQSYFEDQQLRTLRQWRCNFQN